MHGLVLPRACQGLLARIQAGRHEAGAPRRAAGHRHPAPASLSSSSTRARPPGRPLHVNAAAQQRHAQHAPGSRLACSDTHCGTILYNPYNPASGAGDAPGGSGARGAQQRPGALCVAELAARLRTPPA